MPRALTRAQCLQNAAFLRALARTGNVRLAARETGLAYGTIQYRRRQHATFATRWNVALATAQARLSGAGKQRPVAAKAAADPHRTQGGEPVVVRRRDGKLQVRRAMPGKLTKQAEQAFLTALSATANVALSAAAAGAAEAAFYRRKRQNPGFAREWRMALQAGYDALEAALIAGFAPHSHEDDAWRHNDPPPIPPMTVNQALQLMYLHQKEARLLAEPDHLKRRRGETREAHSFRLSEMYEEDRRRAREAFDVAEAGRRERGEPCTEDFLVTGRPMPDLVPDLAQVRGWSRADPDKAPHGDAALFGGWRLEDIPPNKRVR